MRTLKKSLSLVLVLAMVCSFFVMGTSAAFEDADEITAKYTEAIEVMNGLKILQGSNGEFNPQGTLTRAQAARIIVAMLQAESLAKTAVCTFEDVATTDWFYDEIAYCQSIGLLKGYGDGNVGPNDELTGPAFALMLMKAIGIDTSSVKNFPLDVVTLAVANKIATVDQLVAEPFTREMAAGLAYTALNKGVDTVKTVSKYVVLAVAGGSAPTVAGDEFDTYVEAKAACDAETKVMGTDYTISAISYTTTVTEGALAANFKLKTKTTDDDAFGRDLYKRYIDVDNDNVIDATETVVYTETATPVATYTKDFDATTVTALTTANPYYFHGSTSVVVNGGTLGTCDTLAELYALDLTGCVIELYDTVTTDIYAVDKIVVCQPTLAKIKSVTSGYTTAALNQIVLTVYDHNTGATDVTFTDDGVASTLCAYEKLFAELGEKGLAKDDYVITYWTGLSDETAANLILGFVSEAATVNGYVKSVKGAVVTLADGAEYTISSNYNTTAFTGLAASSAKERCFYLDPNGCIIGYTNVTATAEQLAWNYAFVVDYAKANASAASLSSAATAGYERIKLFTTEGKVVVLDTAFEYDTDGLTVKTVFDGTPAYGELVAYQLDANGKVKAGVVATQAANALGDFEQGTAIAITSGNYASDSTIFFLVEDGMAAGTFDATKAAVVKGYKNVPSSVASGDYTAGKAFAAGDAAEVAHKAAVVTVGVPSGKLPSAVQKTTTSFAMITDATPVVTENAKDATKSDYTYTAIVDGKETELVAMGLTTAPVEATGSEALATGKLYTVVLNEDGTLNSIDGLDSATLANKSEITVSTSGFYVDESATVYVDEDTVYFKAILNATQTAIVGFEAVSGLEALPTTGANYKVYEIYTDTADTTAAGYVFYIVLAI